MTTVGALVGLLLAIVLIIKKLSPVYSLMAGAVAGALLGGLSMSESVAVMVDGVKDVTPAVVRIIAAGVLSGVLICSGAAVTISNAIIRFMGERASLAALAVTTMILTGVGVFIDVAVITVAPIALATGSRLKIPVPVLLMAMVGGGKCGNIMSPNPNTIAAAQNMGADLSMVMLAGVVPALVGLAFTVFVVLKVMPQRRDTSAIVTAEMAAEESDGRLPSLGASIVAPLVTIVLLALRPSLGVEVDPLIALPAGGVAGMLAMGKARGLLKAVEYGLGKMSGVAVLLIGTGTIAGVIKNSGLKDCILELLNQLHIGAVAIAPTSGALMSAATASTTAGATVASASFADVILAVGIPALWGAAMINAGATVLDHLPHGSFFHATGGACELTFRKRLALVPWESAVGLVLALASVASYLVVS